MISTSRRRVRLWSPTPQEAEFLQAVEPTCRFLDNLPATVRRQYAGQWIAAKGCEIIAARPTLAELCEALGDSDDPTILKLRLEKGVTIRSWFPSVLQTATHPNFLAGKDSSTPFASHSTSSG